MRLFRKNEERVALEAAAEAEIKRLKSLNTSELAVLLLPRLGPEALESGHSLRVQQLCEYLLRDFPGIGQTLPLQLMGVVRRALERLQEAKLVSSFAMVRSPVWSITDLGVSVLEEGTAAQRLAAPS